MTDLPSNMSPKAYARIGGALYFVIIALRLFGGSFIRDGLIVSGDATATNIASMEPLWRLGIAAELFLLLCAVTLTWIFYVLCRMEGGQRPKRKSWLTTR